MGCGRCGASFVWVFRVVEITVINTDNTMNRRFLGILDSEGFPVSALHLFNSGHDTKASCRFNNGSVIMRRLRRNSLFHSISITFISTNNSVSERCTTSVAGFNTIVVSGSDTFHVRGSIPLIIPRIGNSSTLGHPHGVVTGPGYAAVRVIITLGTVGSVSPVHHMRITACRTTSKTKTSTVTRLRRRCHRVLGKRRTGIRGFTFRLTGGLVPRVSIFVSGSCAGRRVGVCRRAHGVVRSSLSYDTVYMQIPSLHTRDRSV